VRDFSQLFRVDGKTALVVGAGRGIGYAYKAYADKSVLGRWAEPEELVGPVVYLASEASSYMLVDGGWTAADGRFEPPL
jgi:NAD(P)-dependent dehydrogenase (short-subunit alcohol dehydrogenase family)